MSTGREMERRGLVVWRNLEQIRACGEVGGGTVATTNSVVDASIVLAYVKVHVLLAECSVYIKGPVP